MRRTGTWVLVLISVLVFAGVAYAGNGNDNGKGNEGGPPGAWRQLCIMFRVG